ERDRGAAVVTLLAYAEAEMLPLPHCAGRCGLDARDEKRRLGVSEAERGQAVELLREVEREGPGGHDGVDGRERPQVGVREHSVRVDPKRVRERIELLGCDREAGRCAMAAEPLEVGRARREAAVEVELGNRA